MTELLDPVQLASGLRRIDERLQKQGPAGSVQIWYKGEEPYFDLFFEIDADGCLLWFQLTYRGRAVTWDGPHNQVWTGLTGERQLQPNQPATQLVQPSTELDRELVRFALTLLRARADEEPFAQAAAALATSF